MTLLDILAMVASEELAKLREEEQRKKRMQNRAQKRRDVCSGQVEKQREQKIQNSGPEAMESRTKISDDHNNEDCLLTPLKMIPTLKFKFPPRMKLNLGKDGNGDDGSNKNKTETEVSILDFPNKFRFSNKRKRTELHKVANTKALVFVPQAQKEKKHKQEVDNGPYPPPNLPQEIRNKIMERAAGRAVRDPVLVIQKKRLTETDLQPNQNRFSIPSNQMRNNFLSKGDEKFLERRQANGHCNVINFGIMEPEDEVSSVNLSRWEMAKANGNASISYVLKGDGWKGIKQANSLKVGNVVQLWAVGIEGETCLVFCQIVNSSSLKTQV